jgi:hypothetical protein
MIAKQQQLPAIRLAGLVVALYLGCGMPYSARAGETTAAEASSAHTGPAVVVVIGAPGSEEYDAEFREWAEKWREAAEAGKATFTLIGAGPSEEQNDREQIEKLLVEQAKHKDADVLWLVLIGHGSFDGTTAKFNLRGRDVAVDELAKWLAPVKSPVALIDCSSASAPLVNAASSPGHVVIAATKSGFELNFARFGKYLAEAINDPRADLDKDDQTSLLEAYLTACRGVTEFYDSEQRLASEHALLDDNGDGLGTPAAWFRGLRATQSAKQGAALDGLRAHQLHLAPSDREARMSREVRSRRDELEQNIATMRAEAAELGDDEYYRRLEPLMVELARLYASASIDAPAK